MRIAKKLVVGLLSLVFALSVLPFASCGENVEIKPENTVQLEDNGALITNPGMGWNFTYYANNLTQFNENLKPGDYLDDYPCDIVFFRIGWNYIEPKEGEYNWDFTDKIAKEWIAKGKRVAYCWATTFAGDQSTPMWVKEAGAEGQEYYWAEGTVNGVDDVYLAYDTDEGIHYIADYIPYSMLGPDMMDWVRNRGSRQDEDYNGGQEVADGDIRNYRGTWVPNYDDPVFLAKFENFLKAAAARYESEEFVDKVEFIEVGSFGDWGEGHNSITQLNWANEYTARTHYELYAKHFKKIQLQVNDDVMSRFGDSLIAYTKELGYGVSDHSVQTGDGFSKFGNVAMSTVYYTQAPVLLENHNGTGITEVYYNSVNQCHATYARINTNPYYGSASEWTDKITLRLGYRLNFSEVRFSELGAGKKVKVEFDVKNTGAAPCYRGGNPTFVVINSIGRVVAKGTSKFNVRDLKVAATAEAAKSQTGEAYFTLPDNLPGGKYYIALSVMKDGKDYYKLPLENQDGENLRYKIASFSIAY